MKLIALIRGVMEFRSTYTSRLYEDRAYEMGREFAHRITLRRYES